MRLLMGLDDEEEVNVDEETSCTPSSSKYLKEEVAKPTITNAERNRANKEKRRLTKTIASIPKVPVREEHIQKDLNATATVTVKVAHVASIPITKHAKVVPSFKRCACGRTKSNNGEGVQDYPAGSCGQDCLAIHHPLIRAMEITDVDEAFICPGLTDTSHSETSSELEFSAFTSITSISEGLYELPADSDKEEEFVDLEGMLRASVWVDIEGWLRSVAPKSASARNSVLAQTVERKPRPVVNLPRFNNTKTPSAPWAKCVSATLDHQRATRKIGLAREAATFIEDFARHVSAIKPALNPVRPTRVKPPPSARKSKGNLKRKERPEPDVVHTLPDGSEAVLTSITDAVGLAQIYEAFYPAFPTFDTHAATIDEDGDVVTFVHQVPLDYQLACIVPRKHINHARALTVDVDGTAVPCKNITDCLEASELSKKLIKQEEEEKEMLELLANWSLQTIVEINVGKILSFKKHWSKAVMDQVIASGANISEPNTVRALSNREMRHMLKGSTNPTKLGIEVDCLAVLTRLGFGSV
jgi:hypothetical protein